MTLHLPGPPSVYGHQHCISCGTTMTPSMGPPWPVGKLVLMSGHIGVVVTPDRDVSNEVACWDRFEPINVTELERALRGLTSIYQRARARLSVLWPKTREDA